MTGGQVEVVGVLVAIGTSLSTVWLTATGAARNRRAAATSAADKRQAELAAVREEGYREGGADKARDLQPKLDLALDRLAATRQERDRLQRALDAATIRIDKFEDTLREIYRHRDGGE